MEVRTLGRLAQFGCTSCEEGPPSSAAILALYRKEPGAWGKVAGSTLLRAALVAPGVGLAAYLAGGRGGRLLGVTAAGSLVASVGITLFLAAFYALKGVPQQSATAPAQTASPAPQTPPSVSQTATSPTGSSPVQTFARDVRDTVSTALDAARDATTPAARPSSSYGGAFGSRPW